MMNTRIRDIGSPPVEDRKSEELKYRWAIVVLVFLINVHTWGLIGSYSIFLAYYLHSGAFENRDPLTLAFVAGLSFSIALLVAPLVTRFSPWIGTRPTVMIGVFLESGGLIAASFSTKIWHLVLAQGLLFGAGVGLIVNVTVSIVPQWFVARRSFAVALTTAGSGTGGLIFSLSIQPIIDSLGVSWAFRILAFASFAINGLATLFLRDRNHALGSVHRGFNTGLFKNTEFCLFLAWGFFSQFGFGITIFSMSDFAQTMGFTSQQGSYANAVFNLSQAVGRPLIGLASDRFGRLNVAGISTFIASASTLLIWILAGKSFPGTIVYTLFGAFASNMWTTAAPVAAEVMGLQTLPSGEYHGSASLPGRPLTYFTSFIDLLDRTRFAYNIR
ncbi:major facilitator superfamily transporter [Paramyrothecium foliicola]|nr:major facilitator superfamily transporter [Paramyrothecium foliicola]